MKKIQITRNHLKNRVLVKVLPSKSAGQERGTEFQPTDILKCFEELDFGPNTEACPPLAGWDKRPF